MAKIMIQEYEQNVQKEDGVAERSVQASFIS